MFPTAEPAAPRCAGRTQPGAAALMSWCVYDYGRGARNWGIYVCRTVRGSSNRSIHGDGRAGDVYFPGVANPAGTALVNLLLPHVGTLGIQRIIWNRTIWDSRSPRGRRYTGTSPHTDHIHWELTWHAARTLTLPRVRQVMTGRVAIPAPAPAPQPIVVAPEPPPPPKPKVRPMMLCKNKGEHQMWFTDGFEKKPVNSEAQRKGLAWMLGLAGLPSEVQTFDDGGAFLRTLPVALDDAGRLNYSAGIVQSVKKALGR